MFHVEHSMGHSQRNCRRREGGCSTLGDDHLWPGRLCHARTQLGVCAAAVPLSLCSRCCCCRRSCAGEEAPRRATWRVSDLVDGVDWRSGPSPQSPMRARFAYATGVIRRRLQALFQRQAHQVRRFAAESDLLLHENAASTNSPGRAGGGSPPRERTRTVSGCSPTVRRQQRAAARRTAGRSAFAVT